MSDAPTPETDVVFANYFCCHFEELTPRQKEVLDFARRLERERDEERAESKLYRSRVGVLMLSLESADKELSTLRAQVAELREALAPFAELFKNINSARSTPKSGIWYASETKEHGWKEIAIEDFQKARAILEKTKP